MGQVKEGLWSPKSPFGGAVRVPPPSSAACAAYLHSPLLLTSPRQHPAPTLSKCRARAAALQVRSMRSAMNVLKKRSCFIMLNTLCSRTHSPMGVNSAGEPSENICMTMQGRGWSMGATKATQGRE